MDIEEKAREIACRLTSCCAIDSKLPDNGHVDDCDEAAAIIAAAIREAVEEDRRAHTDLNNAVGALISACPKLPEFGDPGIAATNLCRAYERSSRTLSAPGK